MKNKLYLLTLTFVFLIFIFLNRQKLFQPFNPEVVDRYLRSQDILDSENKIKDRIFISDEEIYIASGYLYANVAKPSDYNFQHPPFIKYLFGYSAKYFNLPLLPNIFFSAILLLEVYLVGKLVFKSETIGLLSSILLLFDPVFKEVTTYALLDLGQMVFILGFIITTLFKPKNFILSGILLGLAMASKFYSPVLIFLVLIYLYKFIRKSLFINHESMVLAFAFLSFSFCYIKAFPFNVFFEQAKIIKFMLDHNKAIEWGGVLPMFFGGYILWPILFFANLFAILNTKFQDPRFLFFLIPISYFIILNLQLPFIRYFILVLPFLYLSLSKLICEKLLHY